MSDNFFSRWSRRKQGLESEAESNKPVQETSASPAAHLPFPALRDCSLCLTSSQLLVNGIDTEGEPAADGRARGRKKVLSISTVLELRGA